MRGCVGRYNAAVPAGKASLEESSVAHGAEDTNIATASQAVQENCIQVAGQPDPVSDEDLNELDITGRFAMREPIKTGHGFQQEPGEPLEFLMLMLIKKCEGEQIGSNCAPGTQGARQLLSMAQAQTPLNNLRTIGPTDPPVLRSRRRPLMGV